MSIIECVMVAYIIASQYSGLDLATWREFLDNGSGINPHGYVFL